jgi:transposase
MDVHKDTISVALSRAAGRCETHSTIPNTETAVRRLVRELGTRGVRYVYEAGPCGFVLYRYLVHLGAACEVIAPSLVPQRPGDRIKTDRRDAIRLARAARNGELTPVRIPTEEHEAFRDLLRAREACLKERGRARHRLQKLLLRHGVHPNESMRAWGTRYAVWLKRLQFENAALQEVLQDGRAEVDHQADRVARFDKLISEHITRLDALARETISALRALRGFDTIGAATLVAEMGSATRFANARALMSYAGIVPSEYSSGKAQRRGAITKCGNAHLRRILIEAAWTYARTPRPGHVLRTRRQAAVPEAVAIAEKAEKRLHTRYLKLALGGKPTSKAIVAVARELLGFVWAIGVHVEQAHDNARRMNAA